MRTEQNKDKKAQFMSAYEQYADALFRYCILRVEDRETALDLVQDTFTKTWDYMARGNKVDNIKAFLYRSLTNTIIDHYRSRKPVDSLETMNEQDGFDPPAPREMVEDIIDGAQVIEMVRRLGDDYRDAVYLRYVEGLSIREISDATGVSSTLVAVRVHRGLAKLRDIFDKMDKKINEKE